MKTKIFALLMTFIFAMSLNAQNSNDALRLSEPGFLSSARALGMGNAISTIGGDFSSLYINPAGLGLFNSSELSISVNNNNFSNNALYYGNSIKNSVNSSNFPQIGLVYKMPTSRGSMVFAIGYNKSKDFNRIVEFSGYNFQNHSMIQDLTSKRSNLAFEAGVSYPLNTTTDQTVFSGRLLQSGKTVDEGGIDNWSFAFASELQKDFYAGATLNIISGRFSRNKDYFEEDPNHIYSSILTDPGDPKTIGFKLFSYYDSINWDISGWDLQLGFIYKIKGVASIGASVHFPKKITITENYRASAIGDFAATTFSSAIESSSYDYKISTPYEFSFGGSYNLGSLLLRPI